MREAYIGLNAQMRTKEINLEIYLRLPKSFLHKEKEKNVLEF